MPPCPSRRTCFHWAAATALTATTAPLWAQAARPLRLLVAGPAGGSADLVARVLADALAPALGRAVVVEPKPGGAGLLAINALMGAAADGNTLLVGVNSLVSELPHIVKVHRDLSRDLLPLAELSRGGLVLVAHPQVPAADVRQLIAHATTQPGRLSYASYSAGTLSHVLGLLLNEAAGIELRHVPYRGSTPALADVAGGHVPLMFDGVATSLPLLRAGQIKALAISSPERSPLLPEVPTFAEAGLPQLTAVGWVGLWAAATAPSSAWQPLLPVVQRVVASPEVQARLRATGFEPGRTRQPDDMRRDLQRDHARVGAVLRRIGFKPE